ncbi:MAG TPA: FkbM family methyltransferase [Polyangiaceae bacterium]
MRAFQTTRRLWRWAKRRDAFCFEDVDLPQVVLGSDYGSHCVYSGSLGPGSIVYSFGVGEDASFDVALIETFGAQVHAFDPTPRSIEWVKAQTLPPSFHFLPVGIAEFDGEGEFHPPTNPAHVSHSLLPRASATGAPVKVEFRTLKTLMNDLGHARIDLLKLDIEGSEYAVLDQLLDQAIAVDQILVEYHHQFKNVPPSRTRASVQRLRKAGYRVFYISATGREFSLVHERSLPT